MMRLVRTACLAAVSLLIDCAAGPVNRTSYLGTGPNRCLASNSDCHASSQCCSNWCVNGVCEYRP